MLMSPASPTNETRWAGFFPWLNTTEWPLVSEVLRAASNPRGVVLERSPERGRWGPRATDGFYIGTPLPLSRILMRWSDEGFWDPSLVAAARPSDHLIYEDYLARAFHVYKVDIVASPRNPDPHAHPHPHPHLTLTSPCRGTTTPTTPPPATTTAHVLYTLCI